MRSQSQSFRRRIPLSLISAFRPVSGLFPAFDFSRSIFCFRLFQDLKKTASSRRAVSPRTTSIYFRRFAEKAEMFELVMHPTSWDPPPARSSLGSACCIAGSLEHGPGPHFAAPGCRVLTLTVEWVPCGGESLALKRVAWGGPAWKRHAGKCRDWQIHPARCRSGGAQLRKALKKIWHCISPPTILPLPAERWLVQLLMCVHCLA